MNIDYTGRHIDVTPALREFAEEKLRKLERLLDGPLDIHVVLAIEKHRHVAEIQVKSRNAVFSGAHETGDLYLSIGEVADKLERQALKHKEKLRDHKHRQSHRDPDVAARMEANAAPEEVEPEAEPPRPRFARTTGYRLKPMTPEDAVIELEAGDEDVLVFRESASDRVCVLHRGRDGQLRLIEPDF